MRILVTGAGRGGTSLVREVVKGLNIVKWYPRRGEEDKRFFEYKELPDSYGTKLATEHKDFSVKNILNTISKHQDLRIVFSLRHPIDNCMAKIVRGQKASNGGDITVERRCADAVAESAITAVIHAQYIHEEIARRFPGRIHIVQMENLILYSRREVKKIATFLGIKSTKEAFEFYKYNINRWQRKRYGNKLHRSQVEIHKKWDRAYGGFFKNREDDIKEFRRSFNG